MVSLGFAIVGQTGSRPQKSDHDFFWGANLAAKLCLIRHVHLLLLFSHPVVSDSAISWTAARQASCPSPSPKVCPSSPDLSPTNYHFNHFDNYLQGKMLPQPAGGRKCFPRVCGILKHGFLHYKNKQTYFLLAKCVDGNGSYFD